MDKFGFVIAVCGSELFLIWKELGMGKKFPHEWLSRNSEK